MRSGVMGYSSVAMLALLFAAATAAGTCSDSPLPGCIYCGNGQTCYKIRTLPARTQQECCQQANNLPIPAQFPIHGVMWQWDKAGRNCTVFAGNEPEVLTGTAAVGRNCVFGRLRLDPAPAPAPTPVAPAPAGAKNVLYIAIDDLRPELSLYDHPIVHTPHLAALSKQSLVFEQAFCQVALCGPSRNSFMSGRRPDSTTAFNFGRHIRLPDVGPAWTTMPEHFKNNGYEVLSSGKLYHPNLPPLYDTPRSWSPENGDGVVPGSGVYLNDDRWPNNPQGADKSQSDCAEHQPTDICGPISWCAVNNSAVIPTLGDEVNVKLATSRLRGVLKKQPQQQQRPFFLSVGLHKPHLPWSVPKEFFDLYPDAWQVPVAAHKYPPVGMPPVAFNPTGNCTADTPMPDTYARQARRAYMAAVSYMDSKVGDILQALDESGRANDTIVIFHADHGWQLGEHGEWRKMTNFDLATRVPLMVRVPWKNGTSAGMRTDQLVELVGVYPTLVELAGVPLPQDEHKLEGRSFAPLFDAPSVPLKEQWALSQYARCPDASTNTTLNSPCPNTASVNDKITVMGYSLRVPGWRYTEWASYDGTADGGKGKVDWSAPLHGVELYDHSSGSLNDFDAHENENLAGKPQYQALQAALSQQLRAIVANSTWKNI